jgi:hypothetical protein
VLLEENKTIVDGDVDVCLVAVVSPLGLDCVPIGLFDFFCFRKRSGKDERLGVYFTWRSYQRRSGYVNNSGVRCGFSLCCVCYCPARYTTDISVILETYWKLGKPNQSVLQVSIFLRGVRYDIHIYSSSFALWFTSVDWINILSLGYCNCRKVDKMPRVPGYDKIDINLFFNLAGYDKIEINLCFN